MIPLSTEYAIREGQQWEDGKHETVHHTPRTHDKTRTSSPHTPASRSMGIIGGVLGGGDTGFFVSTLSHTGGRHMKTNITVNTEQELFVIPCGAGFTCLGFSVCFNRSVKLAQELGMTVPAKRYKATRGAYEYYERLIEIARQRHNKTGWKSNSELTPQLIGLEGKRVEVKDCYGEVRRFKVGKSTGFIPCHLELANSRSTGGGAVMGAPFEYVKVIS